MIFIGLVKKFDCLIYVLMKLNFSVFDFNLFVVLVISIIIRSNYYLVICVWFFWCILWIDVFLYVSNNNYYLVVYIENKDLLKLFFIN